MFARRAKADFPNDHAGYRMLADLYFMTGDLDRTLAEYRALNQQHPLDVQLKKNYIQLLLQKGQLSEAGNLDRQILNEHPDDPDALVYQSQIQISSGHANEAVATLQNVIKNDPNNSEAHYVLGVGLQKLGDSARAESAWIQAVRLRPDLLDAIRALAAVAMGRNDMDALDQQASEIIRLQPASPEGYALRALSNINRKRFAVAETDIQKAIDIAPQNSFGYVQRGNLKFAENQFDAAAKSYQAALDRNPNSKDALRGLMHTYVVQNRVEQAIAVANAQVKLSPGNSGFYELLGTTLFQYKKDWDGAQAAFEKICRPRSEQFRYPGQTGASTSREGIDGSGDCDKPCSCRKVSKRASFLHPLGQPVPGTSGLEQRGGSVSEGIGNPARTSCRIY